MLQKAAQQNSRANAGYDVKAPACPVERKTVEEKIRNMLPSIRPDHRKLGQLLLETAYGERMVVEECPTAEIRTPEDARKIIPKNIRDALLNAADFKKTLAKAAQETPTVKIFVKRFVSRKPIISLTDAEIARGAIVDPKIRASIFEYVAARKTEAASNDKKWLEKVLLDYTKKTGVRKVRCVNKNQDGMFQVQTAAGKWYQKNDVAFCDVWCVPGKNGKRTYEGVFINRIDWDPEDETSVAAKRPHPAAKKIMRLFKNDVISFRHNNEEVYCRVAGFSTTRNKIDLQPLHASGPIADWIQDTDKGLVGSYWSPKDGQNHVSINVLFKEQETRKANISLIGGQRRR
jgi:hypothetical protein